VGRGCPLPLLNFVDKGVTTPSKSYLPAAEVNKPLMELRLTTPSKPYLPAAKVNKPLMLCLNIWI
jgi:hypothetical protein